MERSKLSVHVRHRCRRQAAKGGFRFPLPRVIRLSQGNLSRNLHAKQPTLPGEVNELQTICNLQRQTGAISVSNGSHFNTLDLNFTLGSVFPCQLLTDAVGSEWNSACLKRQFQTDPTTRFKSRCLVLQTALMSRQTSYKGVRLVLVGRVLFCFVWIVNMCFWLQVSGFSRVVSCVITVKRCPKDVHYDRFDSFESEGIMERHKPQICVLFVRRIDPFLVL
ncbi:hypothetical protein L596_025639 [Steinernema carpocapsae]|uniref:Uncharacterized protein n=1 Tax=Steinernema carpocapsae TaxID=34508 RepID=A0A4U5M8D2_STECR|nr:hypothetical protein L596_025639 [Steinernema carpocapsae]